MKSNKKLMIIVAIIIVIALGVFLLVKNIQKDQESTESTMNEIKNTNQNFENSILVYNQNREELSNYLDSYYEEKFLEDYDKIIASLENQDNVISEIQKEVEVLDTNCKGKLFKEAAVNQICSNYLEYYEKIVNVYWSDIHNVNEMINLYNDGNERQLNSFQSNFVWDYIDYNEDGVYLEKED